MNETNIVTNVLSKLPEGITFSFLNNLNSQVSEVLSKIIPENGFTTQIIANPLIILFLIFIVLVVFAFTADFVADAWKIPIAIVVDIIDLIALKAGISMELIAAGSSIALFLLLTRDCSKWLYYSFAVISAIICILPISIFALIPVCTIFMIIAAVADKGI